MTEQKSSAENVSSPPGLDRPYWRLHGDGQAGNTQALSLSRLLARLSQAAGPLWRVLRDAAPRASLLLLASGLQTYTVHQRLNAGTGARMEGVLTARLNLRTAEYQGSGEAVQAAREALWNRLQARLGEAAASVKARVALSSSLPGGGMIETDEILPEGMTVQDGQYPDGGNYRINAGFFDAMEVKLLAGREFGPQDRADSLKVAVINQNFAQQHWPGQDPVGKRFAIVEGETQKRFGPWITVIGVTSHVLQGIGREQGLRAANFYLPISQTAPADMGIALVGVPDNTASRKLLSRAVAQADPGLALEQVFSAEERQRIAHGRTVCDAGALHGIGLQILAQQAANIRIVIDDQYPRSHRLVSGSGPKASFLLECFPASAPESIDC